MAEDKKYVLISVFDKTGIEDFARGLIKLNYQIISTGGTAKALEKAGIKIIPIQEITGNPESFDGWMKTISFQIESGILFDRKNPDHVLQAEQLGIKPIDIVVCNLYPFEHTVTTPGVDMEKVIENIDVGGPTMLRAAAKNYRYVLPVCDPADYPFILDVLGKEPQDLKLKLAQKTFEHLSFYDSQVAKFFRDKNIHHPGKFTHLFEPERPQSRGPGSDSGRKEFAGMTDLVFPKEFTLPGKKISELRYGENPHQNAALYAFPGSNSPFAKLEKHWGRDLSLVNVTDIDAGLSVVRMFEEPASVVIKHNTPCGVALGSSAVESLTRAIESDPVSAFGGVIVMNKPLDLESAKIVADFKHQSAGNIDIVAVPRTDPDALELLKSVRKSMGIYTFGEIPKEYASGLNIKSIEGGFILQNADQNLEKGFGNWEVVTEKKPSEREMEQMKIAWKFVTRIRSNCVLVMDPKLPMTRGIGSGQTSRVGSTNIALEQAGDYAKGAILASDSFFPFPDSIGLSAKAGISAIVQQGDSINDKASIDEANKAGIAMVFTHRRAFWH